MNLVGLAGLGKRHDSVWIAIAFASVVFVVGVGVKSAFDFFHETAWVTHTHRVLDALNQLHTSLAIARSARRGFGLTGDVEEATNFTIAIRDMKAATARVRTLTSDNPSQQRALDGLEPLLDGRVVSMNAAIEYRRTHGFEFAREANETRTGTAAYREVSMRVANLAAHERHLLVERERRTAKSVVRTKAVEIFGAFASLSLLLVVVVRLRREVHRRERSEQTVREREFAISCLNEDLERRVEERTAQLERAHRELESFSYSVVHVLRAPLRGMGGFAEMLLDESADTLSSDAQESLREITQNARRMALLIDALVAMSRITRTELTRTEMNLTDLTRAVVSQFDGLHGRPRLDLVVPDDLRADGDLILARTLFEILLGNSWKFTGNGPTPRIEVGASVVDGERVWFIRDNGAGFDMAHVDKLFAPFGRLHTVDEFPGIGIGLAMAQRIVQRHGGRIWARSSVGEGASFYFTLSPKLAGEAA